MIKQPHRPTFMPLLLGTVLSVLSSPGMATETADEAARPQQSIEAKPQTLEQLVPIKANGRPLDPTPPVEKRREQALPMATNISLDEPVEAGDTVLLELPEAKAEQSAASTGTDEPTERATDTSAESEGSSPGEVDAAPASDEQAPAEAVAAEDPAEADTAEHLFLLGVDVPPGTSTRLAWAPKQSFEGIYIATPVLVVNGSEPGPTLCLTAAIHGDELNGIETVRRVLYNLDPTRLKGAVIGVPIVNLQGFHASSRYLSDRRDLNRYFPGDPSGSSASRIAHSFFHEVIQHCSAVVDLHTGSFYRTNLPQLRGDLSNPQVVDLTRGFGSTVVLHSEGTEGTLRRAAVDAGIPAVTLEAGGPSVLEEGAVGHSVKGVRTLLNHLGMTSRFSLWGDPEPVYYNSAWQRAPVGGIVFSKVSLGQNVREGEVLGTVTNPITNVRTRIVSSHNGRVIGMALNQVVQPGFATHHIGIAAPRGKMPEELVETAEETTDEAAEGSATAANESENGSHQELSADDESDEGGPLADD